MSYIALANTTLTSATNSVTFSNIPNTYRDLVLVVNGAASGDDNQGAIRFNGDSSTSNYTTVQMAGYGSNLTFSNVRSSDGYANLTPAFSWPPNQAIAVVQIMDYSATDKHKTVLNRFGHATALVQATASRWASTSAINSMTVYLQLFGPSRTFNVGTTFALYGIAG